MEMSGPAFCSYAEKIITELWNGINVLAKLLIVVGGIRYATWRKECCGSLMHIFPKNRLGNKFKQNTCRIMIHWEGAVRFFQSNCVLFLSSNSNDKNSNVQFKVIYKSFKCKLYIWIIVIHIINDFLNFKERSI